MWLRFGGHLTRRAPIVVERGSPGGREMQKKLLTMAVAAAFAAPCIAFAQADVEVYGRITTAFGRFNYSQATNGAPSVSKWDVAQGGSIFGVRGRERLAAGVTAWF